ncbi:uncharacterized protein LOC100205443 isoform X1 [Hydra vulgaris]|uniref:uncharacterized protein LOC100205443 isoform X1 n=1 Tax=Hydra vulgaris TaxID=6087 RepID=UPI0001926994|nr:protein PLANT CADMIUM RESISTANCE 3 [Hydra vulgaris]
MSQFKNGICGCCSDISTCCITYFLPCVTAGKNAEHVNKNCCLYGFLGITCVGPITRAIIRSKVREKYNIEGSCCGDFICHLFCPLCALVQESREAQANGAPGPLSMARE